MELSKVSKIILGIVIIAVLVGGLLGISKILKKGDSDKLTIGILQLVDHKALDDARQGFIDELKNLGVDANIDIKNAQGETANASLIANKFVSDEVDLIYAIATSSAQATRQATRDKKIPVIFSAVTDPVESEIVNGEKEIDNVTGVRDSVPRELVKELFEVVQTLKNDNKAIGIIYNTGESNSLIQVNQAKEIAQSMGIKIEAVGITSVNDIPNAMNSLSNKIDGLYLITDNMVYTAISLVSNTAKEKGIITVSLVSTDVEDGIMYAGGINYYELGRQSAIMAKKILIDKMDIKDIYVEEAKVFEKYVNAETLNTLNIDKNNPIFKGAEIIK